MNAPPRLIGLLLLAAGISPALTAAPLEIKFSASQTVACRDVTPPEFAAISPGEKLIEAQFRVSALLWQGQEEQIEELLILIASPQRRLRVVDFWPKTESVSDIAGPIERSQTQDSTRSLEAGLRGSITAAQAGISGQLSPSLGAGYSSHEAVKETYKKLPPRQLLLASGTLHGDASLFFKLKPSTQGSLEGARVMSCVFAVPAQWRGDWVLITCLAKGRTDRQLVPRIEECGRGEFHVGLHLEGDLAAKTLADQLDQVQSQPERPAAADDSQRSLARNWPAMLNISRWALGRARESQPQAREALKPLPALPQALEALGNLSGQDTGIPYTPESSPLE
jgi:hypothetical protein